jgi:hypothetical protein
LDVVKKKVSRHKQYKKNKAPQESLRRDLNTGYESNIKKHGSSTIIDGI